MVQDIGFRTWFRIYGSGYCLRLILHMSQPMNRTVGSERLEESSWSISPARVIPAQGYLAYKKQGYLAHKKQGYLAQKKQGYLAHKKQGYLAHRKQWNLGHKKQGLLAHEKQRPPRTLHQDYAKDHPCRT